MGYFDVDKFYALLMKALAISKVDNGELEQGAAAMHLLGVRWSDGVCTK